MKKLLLLLGLAFACLAAPGVSSAQATRTWVSGVGDDANPCSRTAPCKTFAGAISKTAAGGEINILDPGGYGAVTITKSITISGDRYFGGVLNSSSNGVTINAATTDVVILRGLSIAAPIIGSPGVNGVRILAAGTVNIIDTQIVGNRTATGTGITLLNSSGTTYVNIVDTNLSENGTSSGGGGIVIAPTGSGNAIVSIRGSKVMDNSRGITVDTSATTGTVQTSIASTSITGNSLAGLLAVGGGGGANAVSLTETVSAGNFGGLGSNGAGASVTFARSTISGNTNGLVAVNGGAMISSGGNIVINNTNPGAVTGTISPL